MMIMIIITMVITKIMSTIIYEQHGTFLIWKKTKKISDERMRDFQLK